MKKTNILVVGGGPAGVIAAITAKKKNPGKKVMLVRQSEISIIPCGIPYIFNRLNSVDKDILPDKSLTAVGVKIIISKAINCDTISKILFLSNRDKIKYDKLILATGSEPVAIPIPGADKKGVWYVKKDYEYLKKLRRAIVKAKNIVIIGGGYIGVELAEELSGIKNKKITVIEKLDCCLGMTMDSDFTVEAEKKLIKKGVNILTGSEVKEIGGWQKASYIQLRSGKKIMADEVIMSVGARPNVQITKGTGITKGEYGGIKVNQYMQTNIPDIFAVGDCAETKDFFTGKALPVMLASTACYEARIAGINIYQRRNMVRNTGTLACFSTFINGLLLGCAGLNEKTAAQTTVSGQVQCPSHHPGSLPDTHLITVKLIFSKKGGVLLGGQVMGPEAAGEMVNTIALAIQKKATVYDISSLQVATHPLITPAPTVYPLITAAQSVLPFFK